MSRHHRRYPAALSVVSRLVSTTVAVAVAVAVGACAVDGANTSHDTYGTPADTGLYRQPPQVRLLADDEALGAVVYQGWISNGEWSEDQVQAWPDDLPLARLRPGTPLVFELTAVSLPAWVDVSLFASIGSDDQPAGEPERIVCVPVAERMPCSVDLARDQRTLQITVRPAGAGRFAALNMGWQRSVASEDRSLAPESPPDVSATWAFAVAWTPEPER
jgi:hypothetical protein